MKSGAIKRFAPAAFSAVLFLAAAGCSSGDYPLSVDITMTLGEDYQVNDYGLADAGDILTPEMAIPPVAVCTLPDQEALDAMIREAVGGFVAGLIELDRLELLEVNVSATSGDFNSLDYLSMYYQPKPVLGEEQPVIELGEIASETGLGAEFSLLPSESVDFLELIDESAANPAPGCPRFGVRLGGTVPELTPVWDVRVKLRAIGRIGI